MKILGSALALTAYFLFFGVVHSVLAGLPVKNALRRQFGSSVDRWYRLAYNIFAGLTFLPMLALMAVLPQKTLYVVAAPWRWLLLLAQLAALAGAAITVLQTGALHFLGLTQLFDPNPAENTPLNFRGFYRRVRHPLYTFSLVMLWATPVMTTNSLAAYILFTLYFIFGSGYEERRMAVEFGERYAHYCRSVPRLIPVPGRVYVEPEQAGDA